MHVGIFCLHLPKHFKMQVLPIVFAWLLASFLMYNFPCIQVLIPISFWYFGIAWGATLIRKFEMAAFLYILTIIFFVVGVYWQIIY